MGGGACRVTHCEIRSKSCRGKVNFGKGRKRQSLKPFGEENGCKYAKKILGLNQEM